MAEPLRATFFALRNRGPSGVLTGITGGYLALMVVIIGAFVAVNYQFLGPVISWYGELLGSAASGTTPDFPGMDSPGPIFVLMGSIIVLMFAGYFAFAMFEAGCLRWMVRGETGGVLGLSLGRDTWTVYLTLWIWFFLYMGYSMVSGIIGTIVAGLILFAMRDSSNYMLSVIISQGVQLLTYIPMIYFAVRLAPAAAVSVGEKRVAFFDAWKVTKGRFWELFGSFFVIYLIVIVGEVVIFGAVIALFFGSVWSTLANMGSDPTGQQTLQAIASIFTAQNMAILATVYLIVLVLGLLVYILFYGINARAVIAAADEGKVQGLQTAAVAQTFD